MISGRTMPVHAKLKEYRAVVYDPKTDNRVKFQMKAFNDAHADNQARDGFFGLLAPPSDERRAELEVELRIV